MKNNISGNSHNILDSMANEELRRTALRNRCEEYRASLRKRNPHEIARMAALSIREEAGGGFMLGGDHLLKTYLVSWPGLKVVNSKGDAASLQTEALWLHYLDRADGYPLTGRWVNLSEIGGLFYQQAFQGYCGDELAESWDNDIEGLRQSCLDAGGWPVNGLADLAFEWRVLPRLPLCLCYRLPAVARGAWATILFDAAANHYVAADVAATVGKKLADRLKQGYKG